MVENVILPPSYIRFDKRQREEFLSQFGITAPAQRDLFHQLCSSWKPVMDFDAFVGARLGQFDHVENELVGLMARLKTAKLGQLTTRRIEGGERRYDKIILCEEAQDRYWFYFLQDLLVQASDNPHNPYLTFPLLKSREILIPIDLFHELSPERVSKSGFEELAAEESLLLLTLQEEKVLSTSQSLSALMSFSIAKLRTFLKNPEVLAQVSRTLNVGLTDLAKRVDEKDMSFWRSLTEALVINSQDLLADRKLHLEKSFFQAAEFFRLYSENQLIEFRKQKEKEKERETDHLQIEQMVLKDKDILVAPQDFESQVKLLFAAKYGEGFADFQEEFHNQFMAPTARKAGLPAVMILKAGLLHRDNAYLYFVRRFEVLQNLVWQDFAARMDKLLRSNNRSGDIAFVNRANLEHALNDWTSANDAMVAEMLAKPKLLAEALIHYGKTSLNLGSVDEMKLLMEQFFRPGVMTLRPLQEIYGIDVLQLYESAFKRLNVVAQFWRRLTGKYQLQAQEFSSMGLGKVKPLSIRAAVGGGGATRPNSQDLRPIDQLSPAEKQARRKEWMNRKRSAPPQPSEATQTKEKMPPPRSARHYSEKEKDLAWTSFRDSLKSD
jgi:hypothetical protein